MKRYILIMMGLMMVAAVAGCKDNSTSGGGAAAVGEAEPAAVVVEPDAGISGKVAETMNASGYTYILVDTGTDKIWVAGPMTQVKVGDEVSVPQGSPISNFKSTSLKREFDSIIFAPAIMVAGAEQSFDQAAGLPAGHPGGDTPTANVMDFSGLTKADGGKTVAEIFAEKASLNESEVAVRGKVVKYMSGIMGKNWLHIKDGTGAVGTDDLVVTTQDTAKQGDTVLVKGKVFVDKDFGSGYRYDVIVEEAAVTVE